MKCPNCFAMVAASDVVCYGCKTPIRVPVETPGWAYLFAIGCGVMPFLTLGGLVPALLGIGSAGMCMGTAKATSLPEWFRLAVCALIAGCAWVLFWGMFGDNLVTFYSRFLAGKF